MLVAAPHVVDQNIQPVSRRADALINRFHLPVVPVIASDGDAFSPQPRDLIRRLVDRPGKGYGGPAFFHRPSRDVDRRARFAQAEGDAFPNSAARSGYQRDFPGERFHERILSTSGNSMGKRLLKGVGAPPRGSFRPCGDGRRGGAISKLRRRPRPEASSYVPCTGGPDSALWRARPSGPRPALSCPWRCSTAPRIPCRAR